MNINPILFIRFMNLLKADLHTHTKYSIEPLFGILLQLRAYHGPEALIEAARKKGINALAITDHDAMYGARLGERYIRKNRIENFTLIKGEEITTKNGHLIGLGLENPIRSHLDVQETADRIKEQGGLVIVPHAFNKLGIKKAIYSLRGVDAIEKFNMYNPFNSLINHPPQLYEKIAKQRGVPCVVGSDAHVISDVGKVFNEITCNHGVDNVLRAIKKHKVNCVNKTSLLDSAKTITKTLGLTAFSLRKHPVFD